MEIYNERVFDLLGDVRSKKTLKVREHKILGPYVEVCYRAGCAAELPGVPPCCRGSFRSYPRVMA